VPAHDVAKSSILRLLVTGLAGQKLNAIFVVQKKTAETFRPLSLRLLAAAMNAV
jgi:hypothetical protein